MKKTFYARKTRQLSYRIKLLKNFSTIEEKTSSKFNKLVSEIKLLIQELKYCIPRRRISKIIGGAAVLLGLGLGPTANAQQFGDRMANPFGVSLVTETSIPPTLADLDGDGDYDLLISDYNGGIGFSENIGTAQSPQFAPESIGQFGLPTVEYTISVLGDLDNDGDLDLLAFTYDEMTEITVPNFYENIGTPTAPSFSATPVENAFNLADAYILYGSLADLDGDGDLDLFSAGPGVIYYENIGTPEAPNFTAFEVNPFGISPATESTYSAVAFSDMDLDGDLDILGVELYSDDEYGNPANFTFQRNTGDAQNPQFGPIELDPFGLTPLTISFINVPTMADMDGDGDEDLLVSAYVGDFPDGDLELGYYELLSSVGTETIISNNTTTIFPNPTSDVLTIQSDIAIQSYEVFDIVGHTILSENFNGQTINVKSLNTGIYILKMKNEKDEIVVKRFEKI